MLQDASERNTCRSGADTVGPGTYLKVLEGLLGRQGLDTALHGDKDTNSGGIRELLIFLYIQNLTFYFLLFSFFLVVLVLLHCFIFSNIFLFF